MTDKLFGGVVARWIDAYTWPRSTDHPHSILILTAANPARTIFKFHSAFKYFEIDASYNRDTNSLANVQIQLVVPGHHNATLLIAADSYPLSAAEGESLIFNISKDYLRGKVSFKYGDYSGKRHIFVTYAAHLPYGGDLKDTLTIAPTEISEVFGFTTAELKDIPTFTPSELELEEEQSLVSSKSGQLVIRALDEETANQQALLVKFLNDFVVGVDSLVIETYYAPPGTRDTSLRAPGFSSQWKGTISFLGILEVVGSIDPKTLVISAALYARIPSAGRVRLAGVAGSLLGAGVTTTINILLANGKAVFTASKNAKGKHDLYADATVTLKFVGKKSTGGRKFLYSLPF